MASKTIETLVADIEKVLEEGTPVSDEIAEEFGRNMATLLKQRIGERDNKPGLRMSNVGTPCDRKLWLQVNEPEAREKLSAANLLKFFYGDLIEETLLALATLAGHSVTGRQGTLTIAGVVGHRDAVVDGVTVDVKSASTYSFNKFRNGNLRNDDPFGYIDQLQSYIKAGQSDELVTDKFRGAFLVADKTLGNLTLDIHEYDASRNLEEEFAAKQDMLRGHMPGRDFNPVPDGASGNMKLDTFCSYCDVKNTCHTNLRTFLYGNGPRYLTAVKRQPDVPEAL